MDNENDLDSLGTEDEAELDMDDPLFDEDDALFDEEGFGEDDFAAEDWGEYEDEPLGEADDGPVKKKVKINPLMIGGGVVAVLIVLYMMGGSGQPQPQTTDLAAGQQQAQTNPTHMDVIYGGRVEELVKTELPTKGKSGLLYDEQALAEIEDVKNKLVFEEYTIEEDENGNIIEVKVVDNPPMPAPMNSTEVLTPLPDDSASGIKLSDENLSFMSDNQAGDTMSGDSMAQIPRPPTKRVEDADFSGITESLDRISERLAAIEKEAVTKTDLATLQAKISVLETGFEDITRQLATEPVSSETHRKQFAEAPSPKVPPATPQVKPPVPVATQQPQAPAAQWVLKAAQPGSALVSAKGDEEVIALQIGDNLPGIGEVQAITRENGLWMVIGSRGRILQ